MGISLSVLRLVLIMVERVYRFTHNSGSVLETSSFRDVVSSSLYTLRVARLSMELTSGL